MKRAGLVLLALAFAANAADESKWAFAKRPNDRVVAFVKLRGSSPGGACDATLVFSRATDAERKPVTKNNATTPPLIIELWLTNAKQAAPFKLEDFEGPDAPAGKNVSVALSAKGKPHAWKLMPSGWFSPLRDPTGGEATYRKDGEPEAFVFGLGDSLRGYRELLQIADSLAAGADSFTIEIAGHGKTTAKLRFEVPLNGASDAMKPLLAAKR